MSNFLECKSVLSKEVDKKGFITMDEFLEATVTYELSLSEVDELSSEFALLGVLVESAGIAYEKDDELTDYSRTDYEPIYNEIINLAEDLAPFVEYVRELPTPQHGEISLLTQQVSNGNKTAKERLVLLHLRLVLKIALKVSIKEEFDITETVSAGLVGLLNAVKKFDINGFSSFQGYASLWILQHIYRECNPVWMQRYYPVHVKEVMYPMMTLYNEAREESDDVNINDFLERCSKRLGRPLDVVTNTFTYLYNEIYTKIDIDTIKNGNGVDLAYDGTALIFNSVVFLVLKENIDEVLETLTLREKKVLELRFGLEDGRSRTLEEVGQHFGVTRERIRQIEAKALRKLRHPSRAKRLKDFLD